jgi:hypothetical protein
VKLVGSENDRLVFALGKREKQLLLAVLARYPLIPSAHQPLNKSGTPGLSETDQKLLDEALAEQRRENKQQLDRLLNDEERWRDTPAGIRLTLTSADVEWLLQVLNDVRVGSWILLGSPEKNLWDFEINKQTAPIAWTMEMAGVFQAGLLEALRRNEGA